MPRSLERARATVSRARRPPSRRRRSPQLGRHPLGAEPAVVARRAAQHEQRGALLVGEAQAGLQLGGHERIVGARAQRDQLGAEPVGLGQAQLLAPADDLGGIVDAILGPVEVAERDVAPALLDDQRGHEHLAAGGPPGVDGRAHLVEGGPRGLAGGRGGGEVDAADDHPVEEAVALADAGPPRRRRTRRRRRRRAGGASRPRTGARTRC